MEQLLHNLELLIPSFTEDGMVCEFHNGLQKSSMKLTFPMKQAVRELVLRSRLFRGCTNRDRTRQFVDLFWDQLSDNNQELLTLLNHT